MSGSHLPTSPDLDAAFVEPPFALNCPGPDLFALGDGESDKGKEGDVETWRDEEVLHLYKVSGTIQECRL